MRVNKIVESCLYVEELERSREFYERVFGFERLIGDERFCAYSVAGAQVLLLFVKGKTLQPIQTPAGVIPPHDGNGQLHLAFSIDTADLEEWRDRLIGQGIAIESTARWPRGGTSLYFRDPDGHLVELITPGCWSVY